MIWLFIIPVIIYSLLIICISLNLAGIKEFKPGSSPATAISVVIACKNEEGRLMALLEGLAAQHYNPDLFEVVVIDDGSDDNTFDVASAFRKIKRIKVLKNAGHGKKSALRAGIGASEGDLIITTDADCHVGEKWIGEIASFYQTSRPDLIIAPVLLSEGKGCFSKFQELEFCSLQGITAGTTAMGNPVMCNGANLAFPKEVYMEHANRIRNDIASGDDIFLLHSLKRDGSADIRWLESPHAAVTTKLSENIVFFLRQRARWISKFRVYDDLFSILLGIVTFVTITELLFFAFAGIFNQVFLLMLAVSLLIKSSADFLILLETTKRRSKTRLLRWFIPSQLIYPFYVLIVSVFSLVRKNNW